MDENKDKTNEKSSSALNAELEALRDTFQQTYNDAASAPETGGPVIQELDEPETEEAASDSDSFEVTAEITVKDVKKKKRKKGKTAAIIIAVVLCLAVFIPLLVFFILSVTQPNFSSFISAYSRASAAETYEDKMAALNDALQYCKGDSSFQQAMASSIKEEIVAETYNKKGYTEAYSAMHQLLSDEEAANPVDKDFRAFTEVVNKVKALADKSFAQVFENVGEAKTLPDEKTIAAGLDIPEKTADAFGAALRLIAEGCVADNNAVGIEDRVEAENKYSSAYAALLALGADNMQLAESMCTALYNRGFVLEAASASASLFPQNYESENAGYLAVRDALSSFASFKGSICGLALQAYSSGKTSKQDIVSQTKAVSGMNDEQNAVIAELVMLAADGIKAENEKNLTRAASAYSTLSSVLASLNISDAETVYRNMNMLFVTGNLPTLQSYMKQFLTQEVRDAASSEQKAFISEAERTLDALTAATNAFSPYMSEFYQSGVPIDFDAASKAIDGVLNEKSDKYDKAFAAYCKYFALLYSENGDKKDTMRYVNEIKQLIPNQPFIYGPLLLDEYVRKEDFAGAGRIASELLKVNTADEHACGISALSKRAAGDVKASLETALKGMELSGEKNLCARQAAIDYMLVGELDKAFELVNELYTASLSVESCELMLILGSIYKGGSESVASQLKKASEDINKLYAQYGVKSYKDTLDILDGKKTVQDVFLAGSFDLTDGR